MAHVYTDGEVLSAEKVNRDLNHAGKIKTGTITLTASGGSASETILFQEAFPDEGPIPNVTISFNTGIASTIELVCWASAVSRNGFNASMRRGNTTPTVLTWIATTLGKQS